MNNEDYINNVIKTESKDYDSIKNRINTNVLRLLHGSIGIETEAGELIDQVKKHLFYGKELDIPNIKEEIGDLLYYIGIICDVYSFKLDDIMQININKLKARYGNKFEENKAINRDLEKERKILEG
jgi:NTP pyrophosphatase (non-canonical NTP hydrolase)